MKQETLHVPFFTVGMIQQKFFKAAIIAKTNYKFHYSFPYLGYIL